MKYTAREIKEAFEEATSILIDFGLTRSESDQISYSLFNRFQAELGSDLITEAMMEDSSVFNKFQKSYLSSYSRSRAKAKQIENEPINF